MQRFEIVFTFLDQNHQSVDEALIFDVIDEIGAECGGYARVRRLGFWIEEDSGEQYMGPEWLVTSDAEETPERWRWFKGKKAEWRSKLNYKSQYIATQP